MKKVTAFVGSPHKKATYHAVRRFLEHLEAQGDVETEIVMLGDYRLETCRGCKVCFLKGEERCPLKDDRDALLEKMMASDGVVFASPNYSFQVSGLMKVFLDRLGFVFHRPTFFGKTFTSIVAQGFWGGGKIERYLDFVGSNLGFDTVKGSCITALDPMTEREAANMDQTLLKQARRFRAKLSRPVLPEPSLFQLLGFRGGRVAARLELTEGCRDYDYYRDRGWLESDYFYPVRLGLWKRLLGRFFDWFAARRIRLRHTALAGPPQGSEV